MVAVGVRELREHLSKVLANVQEGETVVVTKAGTPIARIEPLHQGVPPEVLRLLTSSNVTWGGHPLEPHDPVAIGPGPDIADILIAMRGRDDALSGQ